MSSGALRPLDALITYKDRFLPKAIETFTINDFEALLHHEE
jgi:hypothetical protein